MARPEHSTARTYGDGPGGWGHTSIGVNETSQTNVLIDIDIRWGSPKEKDVTNGITEVLNVPLHTVDLIQQGKIIFKANWWKVTQTN